MVKGVSRRVIVVDSPDPKLFDQAIFIVRNDAFSQEGVTSDQVVSEACRVAKGYTAAAAGRPIPWRGLPGWMYAICGGGATALLWLIVSLLW